MNADCRSGEGRGVRKKWSVGRWSGEVRVSEGFAKRRLIRIDTIRLARVAEGNAKRGRGRRDTRRLAGLRRENWGFEVV